MKAFTHITRAVTALLLLVSSAGWAQETKPAAAPADSGISWAAQHIGLYPKQEPSKLHRLKVTGYYRFTGTHRILNGDYLVDAGSGPATMARRELFLADDSQLPNLELLIQGRPSAKTTFGFDLFMFQFLRGDIGQAYSPQVSEADRPSIFQPLNGTRLGQNMGLNLGMTLNGGYESSNGTYNVALGGTQWVSLSDLTLASFRGYNRYLLFERNPWDPIGKGVEDRYNQLYDNGGINQDTRWGEQAFSGLNFSATELPLDLSLRVLYGKTQLNGGFQVIPNTSYGGQLRKNLNNGMYVGINSFNSQTWSDSLNRESIGFNIHTAEYNLAWKGIQFLGEIGMGRYFSPVHQLDWGEAVQLKFRFPKALTKLPFELAVYRINENVINNTAVFWNTAIVEANAAQLLEASGGVADILRPFASSMVAVGQMTNNRQGISLNTQLKTGNLQTSIGLNASGELKALSNTITYSPVVNALTRSRLWRWNFVNDVGPYDRYSVVYRGTYDKVQLTDDSAGVAVNPKRFNNIEVMSMYRAKVAGRNFWLFFLGQYNSAQAKWSPITVFSEDAYLRQYSSQLEVYFQFHKRAVLTGYAGYERVIANYQTEVDDFTRRPRNMTGQGLGIGLDYTLGRNTGLYIRHRVFGFEDTSFTNDTFSGHETLVELKMFF